MKKIVAFVLAFSLVCCVPAALANSGELYNVQSFIGWCIECQDNVLCDTGYAYSFRDYDDQNHLVSLHEITYCEQGHVINIEFATDSLEPHSYNENHICSACGHAE
ncbi:MAG: hypothetical protein ACI3XP_06510 [Eubacteriales bacterium]